MNIKIRLSIIGLAAALLVGQLGAYSVQIAGASASAIQQDDRLIDTLDKAIASAANWLLVTHQNHDGGFTSFSMGAENGPSDVGGTIDALLALAAAGAETEAALEYLRQSKSETVGYASADGSTAGKLVVTLTESGEDPRDFAGNDFTVTLTGHFSPTGQFGVSSAFNQSLAILGLVAAGESVPPEAYEWLIDQQQAESDFHGSWDDGYGTLGNPDSTAAAIMALAGSDSTQTIQSRTIAFEFLRSAQLDSGGWEYSLGYGENANSTALVIQALATSGEDFYSQSSPWAKAGITPLDALLAWQGESGAFQADFGDGRFDDFFSTVQAIPALAAARKAIVDDAVIAEDAVGQDAGQPEIDAGESRQDAAGTEDEEADGGFSICGVTLAAPLLIGFMFIGTKRRWSQ